MGPLRSVLWAQIKELRGFISGDAWSQKKPSWKR